jgi:hypothetical protein
MLRYAGTMNDASNLQAFEHIFNGSLLLREKMHFPVASKTNLPIERRVCLGARQAPHSLLKNRLKGESRLLVADRHFASIAIVSFAIFEKQRVETIKPAN